MSQHFSILSPPPPQSKSLATPNFRRILRITRFSIAHTSFYASNTWSTITGVKLNNSRTY